MPPRCPCTLGLCTGRAGLSWLLAMARMEVNHSTPSQVGERSQWCWWGGDGDVCPSASQTSGIGTAPVLLLQLQVPVSLLHGDARGGDPESPPVGTAACGRPWHQGAGSTARQPSGSRAGPRRSQGSREPRLGCKHGRMKLQPLMFLGKAAWRESSRTPELRDPSLPWLPQRGGGGCAPAGSWGEKPPALPCSSGARGLWGSAPRGWLLPAAPEDGGDWDSPWLSCSWLGWMQRAGYGPQGCTRTRRAAPGAHAAKGVVWGAWGHDAAGPWSVQVGLPWPAAPRCR